MIWPVRDNPTTIRVMVSQRSLRLSAISILILIAVTLAGGGLAAPAAPGSADLIDSRRAEQDGTGGGQVQFSSDADGVLRLAGPLQLTTLDPALVRDLNQMFLVRQIFAGLMRFDDDLQPVPAIAESYDVSEDGLVYTFHLDPRARFYDGRQIVAADVVYSFDRAFDPAIAGGNAAALGAPTFLADIEGAADRLNGGADLLTGVVALDEQTVRITLSQPRSTFLMRLASPPASIVDKADMSLGERWWESPNASGPFGIASFSDARLSLTPNEHFVLGRPLLAGVDIRIGDAAYGALNLYETGEIDVAGVDWQSIERIADPANPMQAQLSITPLFATEYIAFRTDVAPFDDPRIREAMRLAFPADRVANVSLNGRVEVAGGLIPDGMLGIEAWAPAPVSDLEQARALIAASGYGSVENVPPITIYAASPARAASFRDYLRENLGLRIDVVAVDWSSYLTGLQNREYPAYLLYWGADFPDPESFLLSLFGTGASDNYVDYSNPAFDALLHQAAMEIDPEARVELYRQANQLLLDDSVVVPMFHDVAYTLIQPYVHDLQMSPLGILYLDRVTVAGSS